MSVEVIDKIKPKNGGKFKIIDSVDVEMENGQSLQDTVDQLSVSIDGITNGNFDPNNYYNKTEIRDHFYIKDEVDALMGALEDQLDAEKIEDNLTEKLNSFFPLSVDYIDYDLNIYLEKEDLLHEVKEILDGYELGGTESEIDLAKLYELFYTKDETMNKEEIESLVSAINKETVSEWVSESYYNKQTVDSLLATKLSSEYQNTIDATVEDLKLYKESNDEKLVEMKTDLQNSFRSYVSDKAANQDLLNLKDNFELYKKDNGVNIDDIRNDITKIEGRMELLCDEEDVNNILINSLDEESTLGSAINEYVNGTVDERYEKITNDVNSISDSLRSFYATETFVRTHVEEVITETLKPTLGGLGAEEFKNDYLDAMAGINTKIEDLNSALLETDERLTSKISENKTSIDTHTDKIASLEGRVTNVEEKLTDHDDTLDTMTSLILAQEEKQTQFEESINNINAKITSIDEDIVGINEEIETINRKFNNVGGDRIAEKLEEFQDTIDALIAEPIVDELGNTEFPEGSIYDKIFNSDNMTYEIVNGEERNKIVFNASDFIGITNTLQGNIIRVSEDASQASSNAQTALTRLGVTEGEVYVIKDQISNINKQITLIEQFDQKIMEFTLSMEEIEKKVNSLDDLTNRSIITKINNTDDTIKINPGSLNLRGSIDYYNLSGDLTALLVRNSNSVYLNGGMISPNSIDSRSLNLRGVTVNYIAKDENTSIIKHQSFAIRDSGEVYIANPTIISTNFNIEEETGYELHPEGKAIFNNAEIKGKFVMPNAGLYGLKGDDNEITTVRIWAGSSEDNRKEAPFRVHQDGFLFASNASVGGNVSANVLHSGYVHIKNDEIKIDNNYMTLNSSEDAIDTINEGEEKNHIILNSKEAVFNTNVKFDNSLKYDINLKTLDLNGILDIKNDNTDIKFDSKGITLQNNSSKHEVYQDSEFGTLTFESGNKSSVTSPDFMFTSRNSVRDCNVKIKGSLEVTEEIKSNRNNVVMRSTKNGFAFFAI